MLGWEFPPHISGGLGTACHGLTGGLAHHGVEVTFVIPRSYGDEDAEHLSVIGCNEIVSSRTGRGRTEKRGDRTSSSELRTETELLAETLEVAEALEAEAAQDEPGAPHVLAVDSPLQPYLTPETYRERLDQLRREGKLAAGPLPLTQEARRSLAELRRVLSELTWGEGPVQAAEWTLKWQERFELSGAYGPDLMAEVARYAVAIGELSMRQDFDVIHAHDWMTAPAAVVASRLTGKPFVFHVHASEYDRSGESVNQEIRDLELLGIRHADRIICVSHYTASLIKRRYGANADRIRVVHNAVTHREQRERFDGAKAIEEPIVLFLGRVTFQKGPDYFLEAAARVLEIEPKVKFVMSGSGDMLPRMVERAAELGIARQVHFTGFLRGKDVERMYAMADLYVMPSVSEPFGISPLEAIALDCPVVLSRQSGVSEVLTNALKVDFWDVDDLANKILALIRYPALTEQLTEEGRTEIQRLRWEASAQLVLGVYRELAS